PSWSRRSRGILPVMAAVSIAVSRLGAASCLAVIPLIVWALWTSRAWPFQARLSPWPIGFPVLALAILQLCISARRLLETQAKTKPGATPPPISDDPLLLPVEFATSVHDLEARASAMEHEAEAEAPPEQRGK